MSRSQSHLVMSPSNDCVYAIVFDPMAGRRNRFTVHRISVIGMKQTRVIGRELPLGHARRVVREDIGKRWRRVERKP